MNLEAIWAGIREALQADDDVALRKSADELWGLVVEEGWIPDDGFDRFTALLRDDDLLEAPRSRSMFLAIELMWKELQEEQRLRLLPVLEAAFPRLADSQACLTVTDILGSNYRNADALAVLDRLEARLRSSDRQVPRSLLANGYRFMCRADDETLVAGAVDRLTQLIRDPATVVRQEARSAVHHLAAEVACTPGHHLSSRLKELETLLKVPD